MCQGAIEGCNVGLVTYCSHLLTCADPCLYTIPSQLLSQVPLSTQSTINLQLCVVCTGYKPHV